MAGAGTFCWATMVTRPERPATSARPSAGESDALAMLAAELSGPAAAGLAAASGLAAVSAPGSAAACLTVGSTGTGVGSGSLALPAVLTACEAGDSAKGAASFIAAFALP